MIVWPSKDPDEVLDYSWTVPLDSGDAIQTFTIDKDAGSAVIDSNTHENGVATAFISGGTDGEVNEFTLTVVTTGGRTFEEKAVLAIATNDTAAANLIAAFPKFSKVPTATIVFWLERAAREVDTSWTADDIDFARSLLAAHYMTLEGLGSGTEAKINAEGLGDFKSVRSGQFSFTRGDMSSDSASAGELGSTSYGRQYMELLARNRGGPRVMSTGVLPDYPYFPERYYAPSG